MSTPSRRSALEPPPAAALSLTLFRVSEPRLYLVIVPLLLFVALLAAEHHGETRSADRDVWVGFGFVLGLVGGMARFNMAVQARQLVGRGSGCGVRAQLIMVGVMLVFCGPFLLEGELWSGRRVSAALVASGGVPLAVGALLFSVGAQLADVCSLSVVTEAASLDLRAMVTLATLVAATRPLNVALAPLAGMWSLPQVSLLSLGAPIGILLSVVAVFFLGMLTVLLELKRFGRLVDSTHSFGGLRLRVDAIMHGPWSWFVGALLLAGTFLALLVVSGKPYDTVETFEVWGCAVASRFAKTACPKVALLSHPHAVVTLAVITGAGAAACVSGSLLRKSSAMGPLPLLASVIGGLLMAAGARLAGSSLGGYIGGLVSFSLHGYAWVVIGLLGTYIGVAIRPLFGLPKDDSRNEDFLALVRDQRELTDTDELLELIE